MNKDEFIERFELEDKNQISNIYEKLIIGEKSTNSVFLNEFYHPSIWMKLYNLSSKFYTKVYTNGFFKEAERRMIVFSLEEPKEYPIKLMKITNKSNFSKLLHKDYLGAIMGLGIKREKIGDLIVKENSCYFPVVKEVSEYIYNNISVIGRSPCVVEFISLDNFTMPDYTFEDLCIISTSLRLDSFISGLCNISRSKGEELIKARKILINYEQVTKKDKVVKERDIITVRGIGKYKIGDVIGKTNKGRIKIIVKKFV